jgi:plasmid replication initiation protein
LTQIKQDDEDFKDHTITVQELSILAELDADRQYTALKKVTERLIARGLKIREPDEGKYIQVSWLSSATYLEKEGLVTLRFDPALKPYLLKLKSCFTKIEISELFKMKSVYAMRIFELLVQYIHIGVRQTTIEELKNYLGIEEGAYRLYAHLKARVIEHATSEINKKTDYKVRYDEIKKSRKVASIEWTIKKKKQAFSEKHLLTKAEKEYRSALILIEALVEYGFSKPIARKFLQNNEEEVVKNALKAVDLQIERGNVKNPKAMLRTAIQEKWHPEKFQAKKKKID